MSGPEVVITYNVPHEIPLGFDLAVYFYMTGLSAGSFILSTLAYGLGIERFKPVGKIGVVMAIMLLALAPLNLIADMGQPFRFWYLFLYLNITSPITYGSFLLTIYPINCIVYAFFMFRENKKWTRIFGYIGIPLAISVHGYTGFILALGKGRILWNTALMPSYFLISAMVSGIALMILAVIVRDKFFSSEGVINLELVYSLAKLMAITIVVDLFFVVSDVLVLLTADLEAREAGLMLLKGSFAPYFVGVEILAGSLVPLVLLFLPFTRRNLWATGAASVLVMIGVLAMRYVMVIGGQSMPLA